MSAIAAAAASGGGNVVVPRGVFITGGNTDDIMLFNVTLKMNTVGSVQSYVKCVSAVERRRGAVCLR